MPASISTAVTAAPGARAERPSGSRGPGPISSTRRPGGRRLARGSPRGPRRRPGSSGDSACRARRPASRSARRTAAGSIEPGPLTCRPRLRLPLTTRAAATAGRRDPGAARPRPRTAARPPHRSSRRCPCTGPAAGRRAAGRRLRLAREPRPERPCWRPRRRRARSPARRTAFAGADRLRRQHVDDRVLEAPAQLRDDRRAERRGRVVARQPLVGARGGHDPPRGRLQPAEAEVVRVAEPGAGEHAVVAPSRPPAAAWIAGPPGYGRPSSRPTLSNASPAASSTVCPSSRYVEMVAHLDEERVAAGDDERHEREERAARGPPRRGRAATRRTRGPRGGSPRRAASRGPRRGVLAKLIPTSSEPARPGR